MSKYSAIVLAAFLIPALVWSQEEAKPQTPKQEKRVEIIKQGPGKGECHVMKGGPMEKVPMRKEIRLRRGLCLEEELKLTDEQKSNVEKLRLKYRRERIPIQANLKLAQLDLQEAIKALDQKKVDEAVKKINDYRGQLFQKRINEKVEFLKLLTPEQKKMLDEKKPHRFGIGFLGGEAPEWVPEIDWAAIPEKVQEFLPDFSFLDLNLDLPLFEEEDIDVEIEPND